MTRTPVERLTEGSTIDSTYLVNRANLKPYSRGKMLSLKLSDKTGLVDAVMWDKAEQAYPIAQSGKIVRVRGTVGQYQSSLQITVQAILPHEVTPQEIREFIPVSERSPEEMRAEIESYIETLKSDFIKSLWRRFLDDEATWHLFTLAPGGKRWHHAFLGGLLEHTCSVIKLADFFARTYPAADRDLVLSGALFHDVGKVRELSYETSFDYTDEGRLLGHIVIGNEMVCNYARSIEGFPEDKLLFLRHLILSHHDDLGGSPVVSMTKEAFLLHHADRLDSQFAAVCREIEEASAQPGGEWSGFINLLERQLYLGRSETSKDKER